MKTIKSISTLRGILASARKKGRTIGLVPTMGYFHEGHLSLMRRAHLDCDIVVVSLFVNPLQFGPKEDFKAYPRSLKRDAQMAKKAGVDILFIPETRDLFGSNYQTFISVEELSKPLCGRLRPGHFRGVATVVAKLFNIVNPDSAYFGRKDYQQVRIIGQMIKDLSYNIELRILPTKREKDGLAISSRNVYLTPKERALAINLFRSLSKVKARFQQGERRVRRLENLLLSELKRHFKARAIDYAEIRECDTLLHKSKIAKQAVAAVAVKTGKARLIDNIILGD
jgi:pantoate--beta-alanine ligase